MKTLRLAAALACAALFSTPASAQNNPGFFIPPAGAPAGPGARPPAPRPSTRPVSPPANVQLPPSPPVSAGQPGEPEPQGPPIQIQLPPVPDLPALPRANPPPAAVIGVIGVPDIMRVSTAAQQVEREISGRRERLNQDAQKEQQVWRELQQQLQTQRASLTPDQIRAKERELQERITTAQKTFRDRNRFIGEAAQLSLSQIERTLIAVIRQVAESRGMNLVLHRTQIALNINEFDISDQVAEQLNKILPTVAVPADGSSPLAALAEQQRLQREAQPANAPANTPANPAPSPPTPAPAPVPPRR